MWTSVSPCSRRFERGVHRVKLQRPALKRPVRLATMAELKQMKLMRKISSPQRAALGSPVNPGGMISCWPGGGGRGAGGGGAWVSAGAS
jgi:hypothetical protein